MVMNWPVASTSVWARVLRFGSSGEQLRSEISEHLLGPSQYHLR